MQRFPSAIRSLVPSLLRDAIRERRRRRKRQSIVDGHFSDAIAMAQLWVVQRSEYYNYTYELNGDSRLYLAHFVAFVMGVDADFVESLFDELDNDIALRSHLDLHIKSEIGQDAIVAFGRRVVWYAIARICKPATIVETGVAHGIGASALCKALAVNASEGAPGRYFGLDIWSKAGSIIPDYYCNLSTVVHGDSIESLKTMDRKIDLFINDSDHAFDCEMEEYTAIREKLSSKAIIISDNCLASTALATFSQCADRRFIFTTDRSRGHWWPGDGVGLSIPRVRS